MILRYLHKTCENNHVTTRLNDLNLRYLRIFYLQKIIVNGNDLHIVHFIHLVI